jgi:hypothetical protein
MKTRIRQIMTAMMAGWLAIASPINAQEKESFEKEQNSQVSLDTRVDFLSKYVCRGFTYSENPVIQPSVSVSYKDLSLIGFSNFDIPEHKFNELDITIDFTRPLNDNFILSLGYTLLTFPNNQSKKTQEIYAGITLDKLLKPSLKIYYDFDDGKGEYGEFSCNHNFDFGKMAVFVTGILGYNHHYFRKILDLVM